MRRTVQAAAVLSSLALGACHGAARSARALPPLGDEGEVHLYLEALPAEAGRLEFTLASVAVSSEPGAAVPLQLVLREVSAAAASRQRLLAWGRVPPGDYPELMVTVARARLSGPDRGAELLVPAAPVRVPVPLAVARGKATVLTLTLDAARAVEAVKFEPALVAEVPASGVVARAGYSSSRAGASLTVFDRHAHRVVAVFPAGREPGAIALDAQRNRAYVALGGEDQVQVLDLPTGAEIARIALRPGDRPRELGLAAGGRLLVAVNEGSNTASFIDTAAGTELDRVPTGEQPWALLLDRAGRRGYVLNRRTSSITVLDLVARRVATTIATEAEPLRAQLSRAGDRLYVVHAGSAYLSAYSVPALALVKRVFVGIGASVLKVDPRTDLLYVGTSDGTLQVYDSMSPLPVDTIELPGAPSFLTIDDAENALVALLPDSAAVAFVDLTSRKLVGVVDVGEDPFQLAIMGER